MRYDLELVEKKVSAVGEPEGGERGTMAYVAKMAPVCRDGRGKGVKGRQRGMGHHRRQRKSLGASSPDLISARASE